MLTISVLVFAILLIAAFPFNFVEQARVQIAKNQDELNLLVLLRSQVQMSLPSEDFYLKSIYREQIENYFKLNRDYGISIVPLVEHLVFVEQDNQKLLRELDNRSATATGASTTLLFMPVIMWIVGVAIGLDIFEFLVSVPGLVVVMVGLLLTFSSRWLISISKRQSLKLPKPKKLFELNSTFAALIAFSAIWMFGSNFPGFVIAVLIALVVKDFWVRIPQNTAVVRVNSLNDKVEQLKVLALLIDAGLTWQLALKTSSSSELQGIARRIEMGQPPFKAFESSQSWQDVGKLISSSIARGTSIAPDLFRLSDDYRAEVLSYRIQRLEQFSGRLIIPVNLLQIPAFILMGITPMVAPLILQTLEGFHKSS